MFTFQAVLNFLACPAQHNYPATSVPSSYDDGLESTLPTETDRLECLPVSVASSLSDLQAITSSAFISQNSIVTTTCSSLPIISTTTYACSPTPAPTVVTNQLGACFSPSNSRLRHIDLVGQGDTIAASREPLYVSYVRYMAKFMPADWLVRAGLA
ncbi:unnamed protein product [Protopolystoma xenopodis]|uniref:Uncharacterized protein n=1 Tax=Protopolystoma xenopodis TaxID=117903 RepID=A0A448XA65_9PLAT|nr:unnamed protein product [Protopolystoma xenopodis]